MGTDTLSDERGIELPADFAAHVATVAGLETQPATWEEWWAETADAFAASDRTLGLSDLYSDEPTRHEVHVDDRVRHARCAADALMAGVMEGQSPVTVRSTDPVSGTEVRVEIDDDAVTVRPEDALICFGARIDPEAVEAAGSLADWSLQEDKSDVEASVCRYTNAFESETTYEQWASETESVTAPIPPARFVGLSRQLNRGLE